MRAASVLRSDTSSSSSMPSFPSPPTLSMQASAPLLQDALLPAQRLLSSLREAMAERRRRRDNTRALHETSLLAERVMGHVGGSSDCSDWWAMAPSHPAGPTMSVADALAAARHARAVIRERTGR
jgi:hypothetical protein